MPSLTVEQLTSALSKARIEGDDELYFHLKQQIKLMSGGHDPPRHDWESLTQPPMLPIRVVDGVATEAENGAHDMQVEPEPEALPAPVPKAGAWAEACACDNPDCSCDLTARLDEWSGYSEEEPPAALGDSVPSASTGGRMDQLDSKEASCVVRADWSEAELLVWHSQHLEQDSSGSSDDDAGYTVPPALQPGGVPTGAADALCLLANMAAELRLMPSTMAAAIWLARFQANNFSLSLVPEAPGSELELEAKHQGGVMPLSPLVVGGAVCPRTAILNHSCSPNCRLATLAVPPPAAYGTTHVFHARPLFRVNFTIFIR